MADGRYAFSGVAAMFSSPDNKPDIGTLYWLSVEEVIAVLEEGIERSGSATKDGTEGS